MTFRPLASVEGSQVVPWGTALDWSVQLTIVVAVLILVLIAVWLIFYRGRQTEGGVRWLHLRSDALQTWDAVPSRPPIPAGADPTVVTVTVTFPPRGPHPAHDVGRSPGPIPRKTPESPRVGRAEPPGVGWH